MAVSLTVSQLAAALRLGSSDEETAEATRLLAYATERVSRHLGGNFGITPDSVVNEAVIRLAGYLYDQSNVPGAGGANALRASGAANILLAYRGHRAGVAGAGQAAANTEDDGGTTSGLPRPTPRDAGRVASVGSTGAPFWDLAISVVLRALGNLSGRAGDYLRIGADEASIDFGTPPAGGNQSGDGTDVTARASATAAQETASDAVAQAQHNADEIVALQEITRDIRNVNLPGTWGTAPDGKIVVRQATSTEIDPATPTGDIWSTATAEHVLSVVVPTGGGDETTPRVAVVIQIPTGADPDDYRIKRQNVAEDGSQSAGIISASRWRRGKLDHSSFGYPAGFDYREPIKGSIGNQWTGGTITWTLEKHSEAVTTTEWDGTLGDDIVTGFDEIFEVDANVDPTTINTTGSNGDWLFRAAGTATAPTIELWQKASGKWVRRRTLRLTPPPAAGATAAKPHWYEMAQLLSDTYVKNTAQNMTLRTDGKAVYADAAAVRTALGNGGIIMLALQRGDTDAQVPGVVAPNFISSQAADYAMQFKFPNEEIVTVRFTQNAITLTPHFTKSSTIRFDLGVLS